jgi:hypothetical protein
MSRFAPMLLLVLVGAASASPPTAPGGSLTVLVLDIQVVDNSAGGDSHDLERWFRQERIEPTDLLRSAIVRPETYAALNGVPAVRSVASPRIEEALRSSGVGPRACAIDCAVEIGRRVGADRVITGEVTKISNLIWFVTARVADVRTGKVLRQDEFEVKGVIRDMLPKVMASLSRRMVTAG